MTERLAYLALAVLALAIGGAFLRGSATSNVVPASSAGVHTEVPIPDDLKPPECAGIAITSLVSGTGTFAGTGANDLILGSAAADTITGNAGDDCILAGAGADDLAAGTRTGSGGSSDVLNAGADTDYCRGEGGTVTYIGCERVAVSLIGTWVSGLANARPVGQDRALLFVGMSENNPVRTLTALTYGGQAMIPVASLSSAGGAVVGVELWLLSEAGIAAAVGDTFVPTWSGAPSDVNYSSVFLDDVNQAVPVGATSTNEGNNGSPLTSGALAHSQGDLVVFAAGSGNAITFTPDGAFTEGTDAVSGTSALQTAYELGAGVDLTPSTTPSGAPGRWVVVGAVVKSITTP